MRDKTLLYIAGSCILVLVGAFSYAVWYRVNKIAESSCQSVVNEVNLSSAAVEALRQQPEHENPSSLVKITETAENR